MEYIIPIIVALITGSLSLVGTFAANRKSAALLDYRLGQLEKKVDAHNRVVERTYKLEERTEVQEEKIKVANNRIADLEKKVG